MRECFQYDFHIVSLALSEVGDDFHRYNGESFFPIICAVPIERRWIDIGFFFCLFLIIFLAKEIIFFQFSVNCFRISRYCRYKPLF